MDSSLIKNLITLSHSIGQRTPHWLQGAGGNLSVKMGNLLFIKSSGFRLDQVSSFQGISSVILESFQPLFQAALTAEENTAETLYATAIRTSAVKKENSSERPSMETGFHAALSEKYVFHFHSLVAVWLADRLIRFPQKYEKAKNILDESDLGWAVVPYQSPGLELCKFLIQEKKQEVYLLQNHGVLLQGESENKIEQWEKIETALFLTFPEIQNLRSNYATDWESLSLSSRWFKNIPLYFPDTAVFLDRLADHWQQIQKASFSHLSLDLKNSFEVIQATYLLQRIQPPIAEIPIELAAKLAQMPVEKFRRGEK